MTAVLIATHNQSTAKYLNNALKKPGYSQTQVDNCLDAWRETSRASFDVILIDLAMPGLDAFIIAQNALEQNPDLNIIFVSGFSGITLDTYGWAAAGGPPLTSAPFHLRDVASHIRFLMGQGGLPNRHIPYGRQAGNVVYPDFSARMPMAQQTTN